MEHNIYIVTAFEIVAPYTLRIAFDDESEQTINFWPMLRGALYTPLRNLTLFNQVQLDPEEGNLLWPNGADFDPATLHDWDTVGEAMMKMAQSWPLSISIAEPKMVMVQ
ncbi:MAG: DUF2442 domain-containing protein [Caldilineaceae bacterium]